MSPKPDEDSTTQATTVTAPDSTGPKDDVVEDNATKPSLEDSVITTKPSRQVSEVQEETAVQQTDVEVKAEVKECCLPGGVATLAKILTEKIEKHKMVEVVKMTDKAVEVNNIGELKVAEEHEAVVEQKVVVEHKVVVEQKVVEERNVTEASLEENKVAKEQKMAEVKSSEAAKEARVEVPMTATSLLYWENPIESSLVLGGVFSLLLWLSSSSLLTVLSLSSLYTLAGVLAVRIFSFVMIKTGRAGHGYDPLVKVSGMSWSLPQTAIADQAAAVTAWINILLARSKSLFLIEKPLDSLKFSLSLYLVSFIGAWFNVLTLVTVAWAALCSLPRLYRTHQATVDKGVEKAKVIASDTKLKAMEKVEEVKNKVIELVEGAMNKMMGKGKIEASTSSKKEE